MCTPITNPIRARIGFANDDSIAQMVISMVIVQGDKASLTFNLLLQSKLRGQTALLSSSPNTSV